MCKKQRQVALSHRYLWAEFRLQPGLPVDVAIQVLCRRMEIQAERSENCLLDMAVDLSGIDNLPDTMRSVVQDTAQSLLASSHRCLSLVLAGPQNILPENDVVYKHLERLSIGNYSWTTRKKSLGQTPKLTTVALIDVFIL